MRTLKLQILMSVDGFIAGVNGEMDWMILSQHQDAALKTYVNELTAPVDCIVMGKTSSGFISHWANIANTPDSPQQAFAQKMMDVQKVLFSTTIDPSETAPQEYPNTIMANVPLKEGILALKNQAGGDIITYGGSRFVTALIREGLIDEYYLSVNPVVLGKGMSIFAGVEARQNLVLVESRAFEHGKVVLHYALKRD